MRSNPYLNKLIYYLLSITTLFISCSQSNQKLEQYIAQGEELYIKNCSNCHQKNGKGLGLVYPPVDESDFLTGNSSRVICLIENGIRGEMLINGKSFNKPMPAQPTLTDLEIAEIVTFLYNSWGRSEGLIDVHTVTQSIANCQN